jgi:hypothetical protein
MNSKSSRGSGDAMELIGAPKSCTFHAAIADPYYRDTPPPVV